MARLFAAFAAPSAFLALAGLLLFSPFASADTSPPVPNTPECTALVNASAPVQQAQTALDAANTAVANDQTALAAATAKENGAQADLTTLNGADKTLAPGSQDNLLNTVTLADGTVIQTLSGLTQAIETLNAAVLGDKNDASKAQTALAADQEKVATAKQDLASAVDQQTKALCTGTVATTTPPPGDDKDCSDFATQQDAQAFYLSVKTATTPDPDHLDANGNGIACENAADGSGKTVTGAATVSISPDSTSSGGSASGGSSTGDNQVATVPNTSSGVNTGGWDW